MSVLPFWNLLPLGVPLALLECTKRFSLKILGTTLTWMMTTTLIRERSPWPSHEVKIISGLQLAQSLFPWPLAASMSCLSLVTGHTSAFGTCRTRCAWVMGPSPTYTYPSTLHCVQHRRGKSRWTLLSHTCIVTSSHPDVTPLAHTAWAKPWVMRHESWRPRPWEHSTIECCVEVMVYLPFLASPPPLKWINKYPLLPTQSGKGKRTPGLQPSLSSWLKVWNVSVAIRVQASPETVHWHWSNTSLPCMPSSSGSTYHVGGGGPQHLPCRGGEDLITYHVGGGGLQHLPCRKGGPQQHVLSLPWRPTSTNARGPSR